MKKEFVRFDYSYGVDCLSAKGVLYTKIKVADCFIHNFTTHT